MNIAFWRHLCEVSKVKRDWLKRPARLMSYILARLAELILPLQGRGLCTEHFGRLLKSEKSLAHKTGPVYELLTL